MQLCCHLNHLKQESAKHCKLLTHVFSLVEVMVMIYCPLHPLPCYEKTSHAPLRDDLFHLLTFYKFIDY